MQTLKSIRLDIARFETLMRDASTDLEQRGGKIPTTTGDVPNPSIRIYGQSQLALSRLRKLLKTRLAEIENRKAERKRAKANAGYDL
jgi:hypothetical protein